VNEKILCYLTPDAHHAVEELVGVGLDQDLAFAVLESLWPEDAIYDVPEAEGAVCMTEM
jgi:hypothetical protein